MSAFELYTEKRKEKVLTWSTELQAPLREFLVFDVGQFGLLQSTSSYPAIIGLMSM